MSDVAQPPESWSLCMLPFPPLPSCFSALPSFPSSPLRAISSFQYPLLTLKLSLDHTITEDRITAMRCDAQNPIQSPALRFSGLGWNHSPQPILSFHAALSTYPFKAIYIRLLIILCQYGVVGLSVGQVLCRCIQLQLSFRLYFNLLCVIARACSQRSDIQRVVSKPVSSEPTSRKQTY